MRRLAPEWLLAPVFALPLLAAVALVAWSRHDFLARVETYRVDGETLARRRLEVYRFAGFHVAKGFPRPSPKDDGWIPFSHPAATGFVRVESAAAPQQRWELAGEFPAGLNARALADAGVRLAVETGQPPARLDGADAGTTAFRDLVESPEAERLRTAPLPASTKRYLLPRLPDGGSSDDAACLTALEAFSRLAARRRDRLPPGAHFEGAAVVLVPVETGPTLVYPDVDAIRPRIHGINLHGKYGETDDAYLTWRLGPRDDAAPEDILWDAVLDTPFAGRWSWVLHHGDRWWESSASWWVLPAVLGCLAFLFIPTALFISIRRRRRLDESRARFVNELAHDLRTPVTSLRLHAEMLSEGRVPKGEEPRYLDVLGRETARLSALLANLLDLSRVERGTQTYELRPVDVAEVVGETTRDFSLLHPKRAADLTVGVADGLTAIADRTALVRCLANLLDNAGKFTKPQTPIRVTAERTDGSRIRIVVADEGEGVSRADRTRVFELYRRGSAAKNGAPGTGLGLALVRELAEGMGGRVTLLDGPRGAAFEVLVKEAPHG